MPINPSKNLESDFEATATARMERSNAKAAKEGGEGYPGVATKLGAKEWMNVCPSRRQLLLVRR
jgi:hypothetical protein